MKRKKTGESRPEVEEPICAPTLRSMKEWLAVASTERSKSMKTQLPEAYRSKIRHHIC